MSEYWKLAELPVAQIDHPFLEHAGPDRLVPRHQTVQRLFQQHLHVGVGQRRAGQQVFVVEVAITQRDQAVAGGVVQPHADDFLAALAQRLDQRHEVPVTGHQHIGQELLPVDHGLHRVDDEVHVDQVLAVVVDRNGRLHGEPGRSQLLHQLLVLPQIARIGLAQNDTAVGEFFHLVEDEIDVKMEIRVARANNQVIQVEEDGYIIVGHGCVVPQPGSREKGGASSADLWASIMVSGPILADSWGCAMGKRQMWVGAFSLCQLATVKPAASAICRSRSSRISRMISSAGGSRRSPSSAASTLAQAHNLGPPRGDKAHRPARLAWILQHIASLSPN